MFYTIIIDFLNPFVRFINVVAEIKRSCSIFVRASPSILVTGRRIVEERKNHREYAYKENSGSDKGICLSAHMVVITMFYHQPQSVVDC